MSSPPQFLFDECIGRPIAESLRQVIGRHRHPIGVMHVLELFPAGTHDDVWIPQIAAGGWIVVSADRGKAAGPKLPRVCEALGVRHILLSSKAAALPQFEKARAFLRVWRDAINLAESPAGTRAMLQFSSAGPVLHPRPASPGSPIAGLTTDW